MVLTKNLFSYDKIFLKTKIKYYSDETIYFNDKEMPKVGSSYTCLAVILINFVIKKDENYYPQVFLEECKYIGKEKKVIRYITDDLSFFNDDSDKSDKEQLRIIIGLPFSSEKYRLLSSKRKRHAQKNMCGEFF